MRTLFIALLFLVGSIQQAQAQALTFSYRGLVGASARYEHPVAGADLFGELGASGWLLYGDDPDGGANQSPYMVRNHLKLGLDIPVGSAGLFVGPRVMGAWHLVSGGLEAVAESGAMATVGQKWDTQSGLRMHIGLGAGIHAFFREGDRLVVPLPHLELRLGPRAG